LASVLGAVSTTVPAFGSSDLKPTVVRALKHDTSPAFKDLEGNNESGQHEALVPGRQGTGQTPAPSRAISGDPVLQRAPVRALGPTPAGSFEGMGAGLPGYTVTYFPPDVNGAIGPNHYVQVVNVSVAVFNRTGTVLMAPKLISTLWLGFGGLCETTNGGDPTAVYDRAADRWLISQIAYSGANGTTVPYLNCVAISTTNDPTAAYYRYAFPRATLPDYAKYSVWPDAYYMTDNDQQNGTSFVGAVFAALDRSAMLVGGPATMIVYNVGTGYSSLLSAGQDGPTSPPAGAPGYALALGADMASLNLWRLHADFRTPASSTLTGPFSIPVAPFRQLCNGLFSCVPQASPGSQLASLGDRLMYRASYRNFGDHESLVASHSVDPGLGGSISGGLRWYEVRNPGATPALYQHGTFAPDSNYRWMGSVAMDARGDIGAGYSLSGNMAPSVALTGRLAGDTLGTMPQGETIMVGGTGVQQNIDRWGDYTSMSVDPLDDCTFWYTNQYLSANGAPWRTRVGSFRFPSCTLAGSSIAMTSSPNPSTGGPATLSATVTGAGVTPTGTVQFQDGQTVLGTAPLTAGRATLSASLLGGTRSLAAVYSGDSIYSGSSSPIVTQTVNLPATTTALTASPTATYAAGPITFTATVSGGSGTPTGSVTFFDGSLIIGSAALSARTAGFTTGALAVGGHSVNATYSGDTANGTSTSGTVSVTVSGPSYSLLYSFTGGADNGAPQNGVTQGRDSAFYGVTQLQGTGTYGTIYRFTPAGGLTTLHTIAAAEGGLSRSRLLVGLDGALYGTSIGSSVNSGSIWRITSTGAFSVLRTFNVTNGRDPAGGLVQDSAGTFYGLTVSGGVYDHGTVYAVTPAGVLTTLYSFTGLADGNGPQGALAFGPDGSLYGVTSAGGSRDQGTVFRITTAGVMTTLYSFAGSADGSGPSTGLLLGGDGNFYGTAFSGATGQGTVFRITPAGAMTTLYQFGPGDGTAPIASLVQDSRGTIYGEAYNTGPRGFYPQNGTLFQLMPNGTFVRLRAMDFRTGVNPLGGLTIAQDGNLYGIASSGAAGTWGGIFSLTPPSTPIILTPATLSNFSEGLSSTLTVAQVSGGVAPYSVSINWGDSTTSTSSMPTSGGVSATHAWVEESSPGLPYTVTVTVTDAIAQTATVSDTATVADAALSAGPAVAITGSENLVFSGTVATFSDANAAAPLSDFTATISWGDGTSSAGTVSGTGPYTVTGSHTYLEGGAYATSVAIKDVGGSTLTVSGSAAISDYPLHATGVADDVPSIFSGTVGHLRDDDPTATASEYTVTIDWGDGTSSAGTVIGKNHRFRISGTHTYAAAAAYTVTVSVRDTGGATATATSTLNVTDFRGSGGGPSLTQDDFRSEGQGEGQQA
jgi:uncharacterized repeat protein (TIGR03803 family)